MSQRKIKAKTDPGFVMLATAPSKTSTSWKNAEWLYSDFVAKLEKPTITPETLAQYKAMTKTEKDRVKDVGGYVAGALKGGRRKADAVANRSMITLDLDDIDEDIEAIKTTIFDALGAYEYIIHPTHSYTPEKPRLRLILPLDRPVFPDEYQAIARMVASKVNIEWFDDTTYQPSRLMYWASVPSDLDYFAIYYRNDGVWLPAEAVLDLYPTDWRDVSFWPVSKREDRIIVKQTERQEDPLEKPGMVGYFCRSYSIQEAITTFLKDVYTPTDHPGRWTYAEGSSLGGLVVYDDKFAYSHHGTDPGHNQLLNAFDLVRVHKFGYLDDDVKPGTPINRLPSLKAMTELAQKDELVKKTISTERAEDLIDDGFEFEDLEQETKKPSKEEIIAEEARWLETLATDNKGNLLETIDNVVIILANDRRLKDRIFYDEFSHRKVIRKPLPWKKEKLKSPRDWSDGDDSGLMWYLEKNYQISKQSAITNGIGTFFMEKTYHPVREYVENLPDWDGVKRAETLIIDYLGAEDNVYTRAVTLTHLKAGIARVFDPGCKYDAMITLTGPQGIGKSTFIRLLSDPWFTDSIKNIRGKEAYELLQGFWFVEIGELSAFKKSEKEEMKVFLSKLSDVYRPAYGRHTVNRPRQCIFWGTTNDAFFLRDETGERRTWPVACYETKPVKSVFSGPLEDERDQIWAEVYAEYKADRSLVLSEEVDALAKAEQRKYSEEDTHRDAVINFVEMEVPLNWMEMTLQQRRNWLAGDGDFDNVASDSLRTRDKITALEVWCECFDGNLKTITKWETSQINNTIAQLPGWERSPNAIRMGVAYPDQKQKGFIRK